MSTWQSNNFEGSPSSNPSLIPLEHYAIFDISGPDAVSFLQGQLTNDMQALGVGDSFFSAHCNAKGRMISSGLVARLREDLFRFRVCRDLRDIATSALAKYMVFSKVERTNQDAITCAALLGTGAIEVANTLAQANISVYQHHYNDSLIEVWLHTDKLELAAELFRPCHLGQPALWPQAQYRQGLAEVNLANTEQYLPQEFNFDLIGAVNFKKGCYTGQEVVARLHYKGKLKKHLRYGRTESTLVMPNDHIYDSTSEKACGKVVHSVQDSELCCDFLALVEDSTVAQSTSVTAIENGSKIQWLPLPYAIT